MNGLWLVLAWLLGAGLARAETDVPPPDPCDAADGTVHVWPLDGAVVPPTTAVGTAWRAPLGTCARSLRWTLVDLEDGGVVTESDPALNPNQPSWSEELALEAGHTYELQVSANNRSPVTSTFTVEDGPRPEPGELDGALDATAVISCDLPRVRVEDSWSAGDPDSLDVIELYDDEGTPRGAVPVAARQDLIAGWARRGQGEIEEPLCFTLRRRAIRGGIGSPPVEMCVEPVVNDTFVSYGTTRRCPGSTGGVRTTGGRGCSTASTSLGSLPLTAGLSLLLGGLLVLRRRP